MNKNKIKRMGGGYDLCWIIAFLFMLNTCAQLDDLDKMNSKMNNLEDKIEILNKKLTITPDTIK